MSLVIDRDTQDGKIKLETLKWAEAQINNIFGLAFDRYYLMRGLRINFIIPEANDTNPNIQINLARAQPIDQASLEEALKDRKHFVGNARTQIEQVITDSQYFLDEYKDAASYEPIPIL